MTLSLKISLFNPYPVSLPVLPPLNKEAGCGLKELMKHSNIPMRNDTAKRYREVRKILRGTEPEPIQKEEMSLLNKILFSFGLTGLVILGSCQLAHSQELTASWYSVESLKQEGTWIYSHGRMANGHIFSDNNYTCATRLYTLGTYLLVSQGNKSVRVLVTDRIGKRFANKRIDLSKRAFEQIGDIRQGLIKVNVEAI